MYKLLIVEDERWEREGLVDFLDWHSLGINIVGTACNGIEGFEKTVELMPDIIITDIKMPGMDGIAMSKKIKEVLPITKIIILTGYDDFSYAREAISFRVSGYILKNCEEAEMADVIQKVVVECDKERNWQNLETNFNLILNQNLGAIRASFLNNLLEGKYSHDEIQKNCDDYSIHIDEDDEFAIVVLKLQDVESERYSREMLPKNENTPHFDALLEAIEQPIREHILFTFTKEEISELVVCFRKLSSNRLKNYAERIVGLAEDYFKPELAVGTGDIVYSLHNIRQSYVQAKQVIEYCTFWSCSEILTYSEIYSLQKEFNTEASEFLIRCSYYSKQLVHSVRAMDEDRALQIITEMFEHIKSNKGVNREVVINILQSTVNDIFILAYHLNISGEREELEEYFINGPSRYLPNLRLIEEEISGYAQRAIKCIGSKKISKDEQMIKNVLKLIDEKYASDINLKVIASEVFLTPNYLGQMFKKHTGKSINDYISEYRMEKAKELLKSPNGKINWVANQVGIPNTSYFCTVFKNLYGMAPGEYQKVIMENPDFNL